MKSIQKINVDISRDRNLSEPSVYAKQNDSNSREVEVTLYDNGVQLSSLTTTGKVFFGKGANAYGEAIEISNGVTEFTIPQNALSSPGRIQAEILILNADDDTETLTSASFVINCRTQINPSGSIDGENNGDYIEQIVDDLQSQIDALGGVDVSELQADIDTLKANTLDSIGRLSSKDNDLQSQIDALEVGGGATNLVNGSAEGSLRMVHARAEDSEYTIGQYAVALGYYATASGDFSYSEGGTASGYNSHSEGDGTASGSSSHSEGISTASGSYSHSEGNGTKAYGEASHAEGKSTTAYSEASHAEGHSTTASNSCSHAEGYLTKASGKNSHAEGSRTESSGENSHAEGSGTTAKGENSHAEGSGTIAGSYRQHVQGRYNIADNDNKYSHIVGNGIRDEDRSNAHTLDWDGNAWFAGDVIVGGTSQDDENAINLVNVSTENKTDIESLKAKDTDLQSQIDTKVTREVAVVGSDNENSAGWYKVADGIMPNLNDVSMLFAVHSTVTNKQYAGILQLNLRSDASGNITCPQLGWLLRNGFEDGQVIVTTNGLNWAMYFKVTSPRYYRTFFEVLQKSDRINSALKNYNLYTNSTVETTAPTATFASTDLGNVHRAIADLTARIEALEENSSGGVSQAVLIDWDVNTNGTTQGTVTKDANGLHASGSTSIRIANYWRNDASAYDGITFTAYGSGKLRVEVGGVEGEYKVLGTTPTTYTIAFADIGLTELSSIEINLQTQGAYDLTVSDIYGYTNL